MADTSKPEFEQLDSADKIQAYLSSITDTSFPEAFRSPVSIAALAGGSGNGVHRLTYNTTNATSNATPATIVLKHTIPYVFTVNGAKVVWDTWPFGILAQREVPSTEFVKIPKVYWVDEVKRVMLMEDTGLKSLNLKNLLLSEKIPDNRVFAKIGEELGKYLAILHSWGRSTDIIEKYENKDSRVIASWRTFGRLEDSLAKTYPDLPESLKLKVKTYCEEEKVKALTGKDLVIMGDFWTGNCMVNLDDAGELESLYIVDWELIRPGDAATELSQMLAEVWEGGEFGQSPSAKAAAKDLSTGLCSAYKHGAGSLPENLLKDVMLAAGAHVVVWAPIGFAAYGDAQKFKTAQDKASQFMWEAFGESVNSQDWGLAALGNL
ncbi:hypothetical protein H072_10560 [Dactylellina haptotyla CBS 200.50]|uniref:Aminoglycoside phosphotransferase domain-containing protein n=1 Tax=Dactylellina haptotyla (strain CBS 200.50) TaxID=1284197 RepID=S8BA38_DACHA|nr:hypothetical protein H072_10560 [Dactylellina haptotyla CBS 200.50]